MMSNSKPTVSDDTTCASDLAEQEIEARIQEALEFVEIDLGNEKDAREPAEHDINIMKESLKMCFFCRVEVVAYMYLPCGHSVICEKCYQTYQKAIPLPNKCAICKQVIASVKRINQNELY